MKLWLGGRVADAELLRMLEAGRMPYYISSFATIDPKKLQAIDPAKFRFFLDSGAFTAWSKGKTVDLDEYCAFIRANSSHIDEYVALDVIPGKLGGPPATHAERESAAAQSWVNYLWMKADGLNPIPVYHYGEDQSHLIRMLDHGCDYIGIGGLVGVPTSDRRLWLDTLFALLKHYPKVKTHGFGVSSAPLLARYPWYSADATAWIKAGLHGSIFLPAMSGGQFIFDRSPMTVYVTEKSTKSRGDSSHVNMFSPSMVLIVHRWLEEYCGVTLEQVQQDHFHRAVANIGFFRNLERASKVWS